MKFSVAMCVWNGDDAEHFSQAIESIIKNTLIPDEIIIVVDGFVNQSIQNVLIKYADNLKITYLNKNYGHAYARNISLQKCSNDIVALMDADDICVSDRFEKQINYMKKYSDIDVLGGQIAEFSGNIENIISRRLVPVTYDEIGKKLKYTNPFNNVTVMMKKSAFTNAGGYDVRYFPEDWFLFIKMYINKYKMHNLEDILCYVRIDDIQNRRSGIKYVLKMKKNYDFLLKNKIINIFEYILYLIIRFIVHGIMNNYIRNKVYKNLLRK